jgi:hypothetical protein
VFLLDIIGEGRDELVNKKAFAPELELQLCHLNSVEEIIPWVPCFHSIDYPIFVFLISHVGTPCRKGHTNSLPDMLVQQVCRREQFKEVREMRRPTWGVFAGIDSPMVFENISNSPSLVHRISQTRFESEAGGCLWENSLQCLVRSRRAQGFDK